MREQVDALIATGLDADEALLIARRRNQRVGAGSRGLSTRSEQVVVLGLAVAAYVGGRWFAGGRRMDFVRFSGELFIYFVLIALGGGVLAAFTVKMFEAIDVSAI